MKKRFTLCMLFVALLCSCFFPQASAVGVCDDSAELTTDTDHVTYIELERKWVDGEVVCYQGQAEIEVRYEEEHTTQSEANVPETAELIPAWATLTVMTNRVEGEMKVVINITTPSLIVSAVARDISTYGDWGNRYAPSTSASNLLPMPSIELVQEFSGFDPKIISGTQYVSCGVGDYEVVGGTGVFGPVVGKYDISTF